ncbi:Hypothetical protein PFR_JS9-2_2396 [Propionibacterium freudenreichii]|nr:Hypothetical protein PFR_JS9-1_2400 [Propionibacterium freudenreichii]SCQ71671.1 Hypothetical protein PFR_JS9-2_2396 [Propionibacterium freudenreichii]SCQ77668.1 Hypothetical protein PFR_JS20-1_2371 [Propionibacterium freudenreichii]SCQ83605.1 Hypothetical protein PFR_JS20-2_2379 [Propionibacterium freudenreichii]
MRRRRAVGSVRTISGVGAARAIGGGLQGTTWGRAVRASGSQRNYRDPIGALVQRNGSTRGWGEAHVSSPPVAAGWGRGRALERLQGNSRVRGRLVRARFGASTARTVHTVNRAGALGVSEACWGVSSGSIHASIRSHCGWRLSVAGDSGSFTERGGYGARTPRAVGRSPLGPLRCGSPARVGTGDGAVPQSVRAKRSLARGGLGRRGSAVIAEATPATPEHFAGGALCGGTSPDLCEVLRATRSRPPLASHRASQGQTPWRTDCCETGPLSCGSVVQRFSRRGPVE